MHNRLVHCVAAQAYQQQALLSATSSSARRRTPHKAWSDVSAHQQAMPAERLPHRQLSSASFQACHFHCLNLQPWGKHQSMPTLLTEPRQAGLAMRRCCVVLSLLSMIWFWCKSHAKQNLKSGYVEAWFLCICICLSRCVCDLAGCSGMAAPPACLQVSSLCIWLFVNV